MVIGLDTNLFIYFLEGNPQFGLAAKKVLKSLTKSGNRGVTSIVSLLELLSVDKNEAEIDNLEGLYLEIPHLTTLDVDQTIALEAARIRRVYGFRTSDAIQLATALTSKASKFITNDERLYSFKEIQIQLLSELI